MPDWGSNNEMTRRQTICAVGAVSAAGLAGCSAERAIGQQASASVNVIPNGNFITDATGGGPPFDSDTLLFDPGPESIPLDEIMSGDDTFGNQLARPLTDSRRLLTRPPADYDPAAGYSEQWQPVRWGEYEQVGGDVSLNFANALDEGTQVTVNIENGIPNGRYTIWVVKFAELTNPDAYDAFVTPNGNGLVGFHNLGPKFDDRAQAENVLRTDGDGNAQLQLRNEGGPLSGIPGFSEPGYPFVGEASDYEQSGDELVSISNALQNEDEIHFVGAYHYDDQTWGSYPGPWHINHLDARFQFPDS